MDLHLHSVICTEHAILYHRYGSVWLKPSKHRTLFTLACITTKQPSRLISLLPRRRSCRLQCCPWSLERIPPSRSCEGSACPSRATRRAGRSASPSDRDCRLLRTRSAERPRTSRILPRRNMPRILRRTGL